MPTIFIGPGGSRKTPQKANGAYKSYTSYRFYTTYPIILKKMTNIRFRAATQSDFPAILALNLQSEHFLSPLDSAKLTWLAKEAGYFQVAIIEETVAAFLLAFLPEANYNNPNFLWFKARYDQFIYIDRVVVGEAFRGRRLASRLYADLQGRAISLGIPRLACEVNIGPPNPISLRFHEKQGFTEVGRQSIDDLKKIVSLQIKSLDDSRQRSQTNESVG